MGKKLVNSLIYSLLALTIIWMLYTDKIMIFLHPRMIKYVSLSMIGFIVLACYEWREVYYLFKNNHNLSFRLSVGYLPFIILFTLIMLNPTHISANVIENKSTNLTIRDNDENSSKGEELEVLNQDETIIDEENIEDDIIEKFLENQENNIQEDIAINIEEESIIDLEEDQESLEKEDNFMDKIIGLYEQTDQYIDKPIVLEGFVFKEDFYESNIFAVSRLQMICCAADASVIGVYAQSDNTINFEKDTWVRVEGIVAIEEMYSPYTEEKHEVFMIKDAVITEIEPYPSIYVY